MMLWGGMGGASRYETWLYFQRSSGTVAPISIQTTTVAKEWYKPFDTERLRSELCCLLIFSYPSLQLVLHPLRRERATYSVMESKLELMMRWESGRRVATLVELGAGFVASVCQ